MSVSSVNHATLAQSRLTGLYCDKAKWKTFLGMVASCFDDIEAVLPIITQLDDVDAREGMTYLASGVNLDVLGARVGQPRRITNAIPVLLFGWDEDDDALPWGEDDGELTGGSWYEEGQALTSDALMDDATYRVAIRMRRDTLATRRPTFETVVTGLLYIFPDLPSLGQYALVLEELTGVVLLGIGRQPTQLELALFKYSGAFAKPAGVEVTGYWWTSGIATFAFDDDSDPDAAAWGEDDDPNAGGVFAEEF